jgi:carboxylate-amine ligase
VRGTFIGHGGAVPVATLVDQVIEDTTEDAEALGCLAELRRCRDIVSSGTSADTQITLFEKVLAAEGRDNALDAVSEWLAATTLK